MRPRMSGSTCARTGSPTGSSPPTRTSSTIAVRRGTSSSTAPGSSCPSACADGRMGPDHRDLVLFLPDVQPRDGVRGMTPYRRAALTLHQRRLDVLGYA